MLLKLLILGLSRTDQNNTVTAVVTGLWQEAVSQPGTHITVKEERRDDIPIKG